MCIFEGPCVTHGICHVYTCIPYVCEVVVVLEETPAAVVVDLSEACLEEGGCAAETLSGEFGF